MLTAGRLERFDDALRRAGAVAVDHWAPGLNDREIDEISGRHGLVLPEEARVLWRWHNGPLPGAPGTARWIGPSRCLRPLADTLNHFEESERMLEQLWGLAHLWDPFLGKPIILLDLGNATAEAVPILVAQDWIDEPQPSLPSLGALFDIWTRLLDEGGWQLRDDGQWGDSFDCVSPDIVELGVY